MNFPPNTTTRCEDQPGEVFVASSVHNHSWEIHKDSPNVDGSLSKLEPGDGTLTRRILKRCREAEIEVE